MTTELGRRYKSIAVLVGGANLMRSFKRVNAARRINAMGSNFSLESDDKWDGGGQGYRLKAGQRIRIVVQDVEERPVLEGHVEKVAVAVTGTGHTVRVSGRDVTGDLVDCSPSNYRDYKNMTLGEIAKRVCAPFGIQVSGAGIDPARFPVAKMRPGETVANFLGRLAKVRGLLLCSDPAGGGELRLCRPADRAYRRARIDGANALDFSVVFDSSQLFSEYTALSQSAVVDFADEGASGVRQETSSVGTVRDPSLGRHRPMAFVAEKASGNRDALARAKWEMAKRSAEAYRVKVTVPGWSNADGEVWRENRLVFVDYPAGGVEGQFLIESASYSYGWDESQKTSLTLVGKDSYVVPPTNVRSDRSGFNLDLDAVRALGKNRAVGANPKNTGARLP